MLHNMGGGGGEVPNECTMMVIVIMMANMVGCSLVHRGLGRGLETRLGGMLFPESYSKLSAHVI